MKIAFEGKADFSGISSEHLHITEVKHKTFVEVNETGTEAAAATTVIMSRNIQRKIVVEMLVDRPFFFAIRDNHSGTILFMGEITNPEN
ncbi:MAG: serpin family protein [Okeania sp. SIO3C4]|nr:serpin family protein [Okeania sp. SIO3B3]NEP84248.1 serpin family protein [Okeania sp. SIO3B3]NER07751.1 serpin family protein [Okeania sp. SIO3C4]